MDEESRNPPSPRPSAAIPTYLFDVRTHYKRSTAVVVDWLATNSSKGKEKMSVKDILSCSEQISKRKKTAPQYVRSAFKTALVNRRRMTAWYQETELASDTVSSETSRHEYFNKTLDLAFKRLFPDSGTIETEVDREAASETPDTPFSNAFDILGRVPTEDESNLTEEEIQTLLADWSATNSKQQSEIIDDPFDDIFQFYRYVLDMDYLCTVIKTYWRMVATGSMAVPLAAWLTSAGFAQIQRICQVYHEEGITHEVLLREYLQKRARLQIQTGNDLTINEAARSGHDPLYKNFSSGPGLLTPVSALTEIFQNLSDKSWMSIKPSQKPTDFILSPRKESEERELLADMVCLSISDPTKLDLPKAEAEK